MSGKQPEFMLAAWMNRHLEEDVLPIHAADLCTVPPNPATGDPGIW